MWKRVDGVPFLEGKGATLTTCRSDMSFLKGWDSIYRQNDVQKKKLPSLTNSLNDWKTMPQIHDVSDSVIYVLCLPNHFSIINPNTPLLPSDNQVYNMSETALEVSSYTIKNNGTCISLPNKMLPVWIPLLISPQNMCLILSLQYYINCRVSLKWQTKQFSKCNIFHCTFQSESEICQTGWFTSLPGDHKFAN